MQAVRGRDGGSKLFPATLSTKQPVAADTRSRAGDLEVFDACNTTKERASRRFTGGLALSATMTSRRLTALLTADLAAVDDTNRVAERNEHRSRAL